MGKCRSIPPLLGSSDFSDNNRNDIVTYFHIDDMARRNKAPKAAEPEIDDDILDEDSEVDEFEDYKPGMAEEAYSGEEDEEGEFEGEFDSEDEGDGVGIYEADDWDDEASASDSESEDEDEGPSMVS